MNGGIWIGRGPWSDYYVRRFRRGFTNSLGPPADETTRNVRKMEHQKPSPRHKSKIQTKAKPYG